MHTLFKDTPLTTNMLQVHTPHKATHYSPHTHSTVHIPHIEKRHSPQPRFPHCTHLTQKDTTQNTLHSVKPQTPLTTHTLPMQTPHKIQTNHRHTLQCTHLTQTTHHTHTSQCTHLTHDTHFTHHNTQPLLRHMPLMTRSTHSTVLKTQT